jgi:curved DNA-binding protein CbpA
MLQITDPYKILQVDTEAEPEVIRAAFRSLAQKYHPDVRGGSEERMAALNAAWTMLRDPVRRAAVDRERAVSTARWAPKDPREGEGAAASATGAPSSSPSSTVLDFGRYAGWSLGEIARHDPDFLEWLARMPIGRAYRSQIDIVLSARPRAATAVVEPDRTRRRR